MTLVDIQGGNAGVFVVRLQILSPFFLDTLPQLETKSEYLSTSER